jgi:hypothetical protein
MATTDNSFSIYFQDEHGKLSDTVNFSYTIAGVRPPGVEITTANKDNELEENRYTVMDKRQAQSLVRYLENFIMTGYDTSSN